MPDVPYSDFARLISLGGLRVEDPEQVGPTWDEALSADRPFVLHMLTDPNVPPLPPHSRLKQARGFMGALVSGDPDTRGMLGQTARQLIGTLWPEGK